MRNVTKTLTVVSLLAPVSAYSLGIGDIKVRSALNQNLNAEISLVASKGENLSNIKVNLAPPEKFDEAGVAWSYFLSKIKFQPVVKPNGGMVIKVTSREALKEPYLNFLLEVSWPKGNLYREFTVLVDPPADYQEPAYPVAPAYNNYSPRDEVFEPRPRPARHIPARPRRAVSNGSYGGQVVSRRNDTLWKLAARTRGAGVSVEQMMMALYEKNPHAFFQQNVNALSAGKTLKVPEKDVVQQISRQEALAEFGQHNEAWKNGLAVPARETQVAKEEPVDNQLKLVAPNDAAVAQNEAVTPSSEQAEGTTTKSLPNAQSGQQAQNKAAAKLDDAVQSKVDALEKQLQMMQQLIVLKDKQLADLQQQSKGAATTQVPPVQPEPSAQTEPETVPSPIVTVQPTVAPSLVPTPVATTPTQAVTPIKPAVTPPPVANVQPQPVAVPEEDSSYLWILGGIGATLLGLFGWLWRRKQKLLEETDADSMFANYSSIRSGESPDSLALPNRRPGAESSFLNDFKATDFEAFESFNVDHGDIDPVAEADVYLTYGRYQQAEDLIREAIKETPERDECKLKLLEIFHASANKTDFEKYAVELAAAGKKADVPFWSKVVAWGQDLCPDAALFAAAASTASVFEAEPEALAENVLISPSEANHEVRTTNLPKNLGAANFEVTDDGTEDAIYEATPHAPLEQQTTEPTAKITEPTIERPDLAFELTEDNSLEEKDNQDIEFDMDSYLVDSKVMAKESVAPDDHGAKFKSGSVVGGNEAVESYEFNFDFDDTAKGKPDVDKAKTQEAADTWTPDHTIEFSTDERNKTDAFGDDTFDFNFDLGLPNEGSASARQNEGFAVSDLTDMDQMETKLDLAKAYIDMGDSNSAIEIIGQVLEKGSPEQKQTAQTLLDELNS